MPFSRISSSFPKKKWLLNARWFSAQSNAAKLTKANQKLRESERKYRSMMEAITDMAMPNITGDRLAAEMMKIKPDIPVILCTGYSETISDETASEIGIKAFAYKPIMKAELAQTVRKVLDEAKS
jgi:DNA-binding NtrC family response regulator